jgi:hypothetical protein
MRKQRLISEEEWKEIIDNLGEDDIVVVPGKLTKEDTEEISKAIKKRKELHDSLYAQGYSEEEVYRRLDIADGRQPRPYAPYHLPRREEPRAMAVAETAAEYKP